jgi:pSer/pThr/pTyr-binding forkhead associated (FHA) protein
VPADQKPESTAPPADPGASAAPPKEEKTQPFRLKELAPRLAQRRKRGTAAELVFRRNKVDVRVPLDRSETVIGRDPGCDIILAERSASARHARVTRGAGGYFEVHDLDSTNGVLVDGERVARATLHDGDTFTIGDTRFGIVIAAVVGEE